jgi:hypothetical protein
MHAYIHICNQTYAYIFVYACVYLCVDIYIHTYTGPDDDMDVEDVYNKERALNKPLSEDEIEGSIRELKLGTQHSMVRIRTRAHICVYV